MFSVEERFELAKASVEKISQVSKDMYQIGVYDKNEYEAAALLLITLTRAMVVLDPEKTREYSRQALKDAASNPDLADLFSSKQTGQYL